MGLQCLVIPRAGLVPADCRRLGEALHRWRSADPVARSLDQLALDNLRDGELPRPATSGSSGRPRNAPSRPSPTRSARTSAAAWGTGRTRDLECHIGGEADEGGRLAALSFDRAVPCHLVDDILIGGRSWKGLGGAG